MKAGTNLEKILDGGNFAVTAEVGPPKGTTAQLVEKKAEVVKNIQDTVNAIFTLIGCRFSEFELPKEMFVKLLNSASGLNYNLEEFIKVGEKLWNLERLFNLGAGLTKKDDQLPARCFDPLPLKDGETRMKREDFKYMLKDYYKLRGWDENGVPTPEKLRSLEIINKER